MRRQRRDEHTFTRVSNSSSDLSSSPPPMAFKITAPFSFPLFPPNLSPPAPSRSPTELRFSRWNNANAEPFLRRERAQKEIEDDLRRHRRFDSANRLAADDPTSQPSSIVDFRSHGTPSSPSSPSIPGKASKYSKPPQYPNPRSNSHPAFRRAHRLPRVPPDFIKEDNGIVVGEKGISYKVKDAPFEFQYSYTETPKVRPLALREAPFLPFGPDTMPRPWTGRAPLPASKKKLPEFDSFKLPPAGKKGVKPVQSPGPYLGNSGPRYAAATREEILGEPLTEAEMQELVKGSLRTPRQLNMGRDGLTHNMLDNIHAHWKRRRVCKIKCKGVCTVDMDNVHQQLEEKTGGKIFYCKGGVIYLFRGRNYNYRTRPRYPLMLWKPVTPVYPRLVQRVPEGLTLEEATEMRKRGRKLSPICKLGKNGVYSNLVKNVREAFEACELVRINCKDMNKSDCRKIGAKLKDLVPCVLISFEFEHILIWRGKDWKSSLEPQEDNHDGAIELIANDHMITSSSMVTGSLLRAQESLELHDGKSHNGEFISEIQTKSVTLAADLGSEGAADLPNLELVDHSLMVPSTDPTLMSKSAAYTCTAVQQDPLISVGISSEESSSPVASCKSNSLNGSLSSEENKHELSDPSSSLSSMMDSIRTSEKLEIVPADNMRCDKSRKECLDRLRLLLRQAVECGSAVILDDESLDANIVFERSVTLAKTAPPGPVFQHRIRKPPRQKIVEEKSENHEEHYVEVEAITIADTTVNEKNSRSRKRREFGEAIQHVVPHGSLKVDELAKLLA